MKSLLLTTMFLGCTMVAAQAQKPAIPRDAALEAKVEKTLAKMTLDEKIGQMLELNIDVMGKMRVENAKVDREKVRSVLQQYGTGQAELEKLLKMTDEQIIDRLGSYPIDIYQGDTKRVWKLNETMLDTLISKWKVGSILNAPGTRAPSVEQWQNWIRLIQEKSMKYLGIPDIYGLDHNHGVTYTQGGTLFPQPINMGATFNTDLVRIGAEITAYESRAANCPWVLKQKLWQICRQKKNFMQKCLVQSIHRQRVLHLVSMVLWQHLQELLQQSEIKKLHSGFMQICRIRETLNPGI